MHSSASNGKDTSDGTSDGPVNGPGPFENVPPGTGLGPWSVTVSPAANERYWRAAAAGHPLLEAGALYPPIAANLTVLLFAQSCTAAMIQTRQRLRCHRAEQAGTPLVVAGRVLDLFEKRGREYVDVEAVVAAQARPDDPIWTSVATFTPAATLRATQ